MLDERRQGALGGRAADGRSAGDDDKQEETDQYGKKRTEAFAMRDLVAVGQQADCRQDCQGGQQRRLLPPRRARSARRPGERCEGECHRRQGCPPERDSGVCEPPREQTGHCCRGESLRKVLKVQAGLAHVRPRTGRRACR
jgi:hypothetical protein